MTSNQPVPALLAMKETRQNRTPHITRPPSAILYSSGNSSGTGEIEAKLEPRCTGILPLRVKRYSNIPMSLNSKTVARSMRNRTGASTVAPNTTNRRYKLSGVVCKNGGLSLILVTRRVVVFSSECRLLLVTELFYSKKSRFLKSASFRLFIYLVSKILLPASSSPGIVCPCSSSP